MITRIEITIGLDHHCLTTLFSLNAHRGGIAHPRRQHTVKHTDKNAADILFDPLVKDRRHKLAIAVGRYGEVGQCGISGWRIMATIILLAMLLNFDNRNKLQVLGA